MHASCIGIGCKFYNGGQFIDPITGQEYSPKTITKTRQRLDEPQTYHHTAEDGTVTKVIQLDSCFSIKGRPAHANQRVMKEPEKHGIAGLAKALEDAPRSARIVRGAVVGNAAGTITPVELATLDTTIRSMGYFHILYDHGWKQHPWILEYAMASCNHIGEIAEAREAGAHGVTVVLPPELIDQYKGQTINGYKMVRCPAEVSDKGSCNTCGGSKGPLCDVQRDNGDRQLGVTFTQHGTRSDSRLRNATIKAIAKAITGSNSERQQDWVTQNPDLSLAAIQSDPDLGRSASGSTKVRDHWIYFLERAAEKKRQQRSET
jgi:hypothetical protein